MDAQLIKRVAARRVAEVVGAAALYFLVARLGLDMAFAAKQVSVVWPASGLALVLLVLRGRTLWPAIALGAFSANLTVDASIPAALAIATGNTLEAVLGATLLARVEFDPALRRLRDVGTLFILAACLSTVVSATIGTLSLCLLGDAPWQSFQVLWSIWWIGDAIGDLVVAPFLFITVDQMRRGWRFHRIEEGMAFGAVLLLLSAAVFLGKGASYPVHYLIFPVLIWAALRLGRHTTATLIFVASAVTILATLARRGPFVAESTQASLLEVQLFMAVVALTGLFLSAATSERNRAERRRAEDFARLQASEERLAQRTSELALADRRKDEFLAVLGHELRNPLAPLQNSLALLGRPQLQPHLFAQTRAIMERQVRHLVRLVDDLLDVARIRSGKIILNRETVDLATLIASAVELARPLIDTRHHRLTLSLPKEPLLVNADRTRLPQLLANLLNNASKYTNEGGQISLSAARETGEIVVRVRDDGIGMTPEALRNVFELFAQAAGPEHAVQGGLGVGLSLARSLAALHGGSLTAHSEGPGRGSEFVLRLPAATADALDAPRKAVPLANSRAAACRILVVDDNADAAESLSLLLEQMGHELRVAHGGRAALVIAREFSPQLMILDIGMPDMDGHAVARAIRADAALAATRLIALTGYGQARDRRLSSQAGFDEHLVKPVELATLTAVIDTYFAATPPR